MATRLGIEISPSACRIVQLERSGGDDLQTVIRAYAVTPEADAETLAPYRRQQAAVVMWGLHADHRQAVVTVGRYSRMRREAVSAAREAGVDTRQMLADIATISGAKDRSKRRPVVIALARTSDVAAALKRLTSAGVRVRSLVTPALALMSLARLRHRLVAAGMVEAYVALEETNTAIALVRDGALIAARELDWGYQHQRRVRARDDMAERLGAAIQGFLDDCGAPPSAVAQVCVCGGMPELRSMTLSLTERLDIEVEPLDSLFGINPDRLPADDFRERAADMRLAWAAAADWNAPIDFLRERRRRIVKTALTRAAVVAGVATGLGVAWRLQRSALLEPARPAVKPAATAPAPQRARPVPAPAPATSRPSPTQAVQRPPQPPPRVVAEAPPPKPAVDTPKPVVVPQPPAVARVAPPPAPVTRVAPPPPVARVTPSAPPVVLTPVPDPGRTPSLREPQKPSPPPVAVAALPPPSAAPAPPPVSRPAPVRRPPADEVPLPFEGTLGTILYGADRKLAIIDGRIVQVGDEVRGARVVDITANAVFLRDRQGRLRRLTLEDSRR